MIKRALRLIGAYSTGENLGPDESTDGLAALNAMLDGWANEHLMLYAATLNSIALSATATYTIGPTGGTVSPRPVSIDAGSYVTSGAIDYPLQIITLDQYNEIPVKTLSGIPQWLLFKPEYPDASVTLYPVPTSGMTLKLWSYKPLTTFATLTTVMTLPPGYEEAIVFNLAETLAPEFQGDIHVSLHTKAAAAKRKLKRTNFVPIELQVPASMPRGFNIYTGGAW